MSENSKNVGNSNEKPKQLIEAVSQSLPNLERVTLTNPSYVETTTTGRLSDDSGSTTFYSPPVSLEKLPRDIIDGSSSDEDNKSSGDGFSSPKDDGDGDGQATNNIQRKQDAAILPISSSSQESVKSNWKPISFDHFNSSSEDESERKIKIQRNLPTVNEQNTDDEKVQLLNKNRTTNETTELKSTKKYKHTKAYEILQNMPMVDRIANQFDNERRWWCFHTELHPMASAFTNKVYRQEFTTKILKSKAKQILFCFLVAIIAQLFWSWKGNNQSGTPVYVLFIEEHRWIALIVLGVYYGLLFYIRILHYPGRKFPLNVLLFTALTLLLAFLSFVASIGIADLIFAGIIPVIFGALFLSYLILYFLIHPKDSWPPNFHLQQHERSTNSLPRSNNNSLARSARLNPTDQTELLGDLGVKKKRPYIDVLSREFYFWIFPIVIVSTFVAWIVVYAVLYFSGSVIVYSESIFESILWEGVLAIPIGGLFLLIEVYHLKEILNGSRVSIITDDQSEALFASFYV